MQISPQQIAALGRRDARRSATRPGRASRSLDDLAGRCGVSMSEVRQFAREVRTAPDDPRRERRVREIAARVAAGTYRVSPEEIVEMAERRAKADRCGEL